MNLIRRGPASVSYHIDNDGMLRAQWHGLVLSSNAGELSALLLRAVDDAGAIGVIATLEDALLALPPPNPDYYRHVPEQSRLVPVAFVVSEAQAPLYRGGALAAAKAGVMRNPVRSLSAGNEWLEQCARAVAANRLWWSQRLSGV